VDLKDKWRNLLRIANMPADYTSRGKIEVPPHVLARVRELEAQAAGGGGGGGGGGASGAGAAAAVGPTSQAGGAALGGGGQWQGQHLSGSSLNPAKPAPRFLKPLSLAAAAMRQFNEVGLSVYMLNAFDP
jgi:hypothetical protein